MTLSYSSLESSSDSKSRRRLQRNRALATSLLGIMVLLFIVTSKVETPNFFILLLRAAAEAGIIGGLADWFAVTALFRHPLGLPIPHTAILPNNRDRIGQAVGRFIEQSFLTPAVLLPKLKSSEPARHFAEWLGRPDSVDTLVEPIMVLSPKIWREVAGFGPFLDRALAHQLRNIDIAPLLGRALHVVAISGEADILFEKAAEAVLQWLREHREQIDEIVRRRRRWWIPSAINRAIVTAIIDGVTELLEKIRQPDSDERKKVREGLVRLAQDLDHSPEYRVWVNSAKDRLLAHSDVRAWIILMRREFARAVRNDLRAQDSKIRVALRTVIISVARALAEDPETQRRINDMVERAASEVIARRSAIGGFIAEVIKQWDARTLSDRFELVIGSDLQYIRMNGTVVGAAVGALIFLIDRFFGLAPQLA
jgi:uncharacterized membrane-anchored protein YjiN (DUF445 family)